MIRQALLTLVSILALFFIAFFTGILTTGAVVPNAFAQSCAAPAAATGVQVEFPSCNGTACDLTQASCKWNAQSDAASFNVTVTEVETNTIIKNNESEPSSTTKISFAITQGKTYKCDVVAVSACGGLAAASSDSLLCQADALVSTPTATLAPTAIPTTRPTATPTIAKPGGEVQSIALIGAVLIAIIGGVVLLVL